MCDVVFMGLEGVPWEGELVSKKGLVKKVGALGFAPRSGDCIIIKSKMDSSGFEPEASCLQSRRCYQLIYEPIL